MSRTFLIYFVLATAVLVSCKKEKEEPQAKAFLATVYFEERVNDEPLLYNSDYKPYLNEYGQPYKINKLRYLISNLTFHKADGSRFTIHDYHFVDKNYGETGVYKPEIKIPKGSYDYITFTFGFEEEDNISGLYPDLNMVNWGWPGEGSMMGDLGGGYHYLQLEGEYEDETAITHGLEIHMGTARNSEFDPPVFENNSFVAFLDASAIEISSDFSFTVVMNIEEWFKNPYQWDFNTYSSSIMGNYDAQKKLNLNGLTVFTYEHTEE